jgi:hypothetical protein
LAVRDGREATQGYCPSCAGARKTEVGNKRLFRDYDMTKTSGFRLAGSQALVDYILVPFARKLGVGRKH